MRCIYIVALLRSAASACSRYDRLFRPRIPLDVVASSCSRWDPRFRYPRELAELL